MAADLSFVRATGSGFVIYRETSGRYVVNHPQAPLHSLHAATLAGAYAACQGWESRLLRQGSDRSAGC
ncbi:MAG: hypothetical protein ACKOZT_00630 [Cyanobium sp.]